MSNTTHDFIHASVLVEDIRAISALDAVLVPSPYSRRAEEERVTALRRFLRRLGRPN